jgi:hypothetical protein
VAYSFRGVGAMHYGKRDFRPDGSYVTTLWAIFLYLPVFPIHSKRLRPTGEVKYFSMRPVRTIAESEKTKPNLKQVLCVYSWFAIELVCYFGAALTKSWWFAVPGMLLLGLPWLLRKRAIDRMKEEKARKELGFSPNLPE